MVVPEGILAGEVTLSMIVPLVEASVVLAPMPLKDPWEALVVVKPGGVTQLPEAVVQYWKRMLAMVPVVPVVNVKVWAMPVWLGRESEIVILLLVRLPAKTAGITNPPNWESNNARAVRVCIILTADQNTDNRPYPFPPFNNNTTNYGNNNDD